MSVAILAQVGYLCPPGLSLRTGTQSVFPFAFQSMPRASLLCVHGARSFSDCHHLVAAPAPWSILAAWTSAVWSSHLGLCPRTHLLLALFFFLRLSSNPLDWTCSPDLVIVLRRAPYCISGSGQSLVTRVLFPGTRVSLGILHLQTQFSHDAHWRSAPPIFMQLPVHTSKCYGFSYHVELVSTVFLCGGIFLLDHCCASIKPNSHPSPFARHRVYQAPSVLSDSSTFSELSDECCTPFLHSLPRGHCRFVHRDFLSPVLMCHRANGHICLFSFPCFLLVFSYPHLRFLLSSYCLSSRSGRGCDLMAASP